MSRRRRTPAVKAREALAAGALGGGVFLSVLGLLWALDRVRVLPPRNPAAGAIAALALTVLPLGIAVRGGFRDDTPEVLKALGRKLPGARTPTEELAFALVGSAAWVALSLAVVSAVKALSPFVGADTLTLCALSAALAGGSVGVVHGRSQRPSSAVSLVLSAAFAAALPSLLLSPRALAALGGGRALGALASEYNERAQRKGSEADRAHAVALWGKACRRGDGDACFHLAAAYEAGGALGEDPAAAEHYARMGCDTPGRDLWYCERFIGKGFAGGPVGLACTAEARCPGAGHDCGPSLASCQQSEPPQGLAPVCARLLPRGNGWTETWCPPAR